MKKLLLLFVLITGNFLFAQVGIGTDMPNPSTQLEIKSSNRGILIPQVPLTSVTDRTTITAGNLESLLVYNINTSATLSPGYYYWYQEKWNRLLTETDLPDYIVFWDITNNQFTYIDENGDIQIINISDLETLTYLGLNADGHTLEYTDEDGVISTIDLATVIRNFETLTSIIDNGDGTFSYTDEDGNITTIDMSTLETLTYLALNPDGKTLEYTDEDGVVTSIDLELIIKNYETLTTIVDNGDGTFTYTDEQGNTTTISISNLETLTYLAINPDGKTLEYTDENGVVTSINLETIIQNFQTVTTLIDNANGTYTYTSEDGTVTIIDVPASVVANFETIVNDGPVTINGTTYTTIEEYIISLANASVNLDGGDMITVTGTGTVADPYVVSVTAGAPDSMLITNAAGDLEWATIASIVQDNETVTTLIDNANGTYTYTSEDGTVTIIDVPASVVANFETIVNDGPVTINGTNYTTIEEYIISLANASVNLDGGDMITVTGTGTAADPYIVSVEAGAPDSMLITNASGDLEWATIASIVQANETLTTLIDNANGTYTYTSEDGTVTIIDVPASVVSNFETIVNDGPVTINGTTYTTIEEYIISLANASVNLDGGDMITVTGTGTAADPYIVSVQAGAPDSMLITNAAGDLEWATIASIVQANETITTLIDNANGTYTYTSEDGTVTIIDVPASVVANFETIVNDGPVTINGNTYTTIEEYIISLANASVNLDGGDMITVTGTGTAADPYVVSVTAGAPDSMLITNAAGDLEWATIASIVQDNETVTTLIDNANGTYTYTSEDGTVTIIDVPASVVANFETIVNDGPVTINGTTYTTIEEYIISLANASVNLDGGDMITVTGTGTVADPYIVSVQAGAPDSMLITNAAGDLEWATIASIVQANETITTLIDNSNGTYTYTSEDGTVTIIDVPASVVANFETIVNDGPVTINGTTYTTIEEYIISLANASVNLNGGDMITVTGTGTVADPYIVSVQAGAPDSMLITNAAGDLEWATIASIVQDNETVTTLIDNANGTYTYTSEDGTVTIIDVPASVVANFETIVNDGPVTINGTTYTTIEEYIISLANASVNLDGGDMITVTGTGTAADPYIVSVQAGAPDSMLITNAAGDLEWATIASIVQDNETVTTLIDNANGTYTYTSEDGTVTIIDVPASVVANFETIVNDGPVTINGTTYTTIEEYIISLANASVNLDGGDMITVTGTGTVADPYIVSVQAGAPDSMLITNAAGDLEWATIASIVQDNETVTTLIDNANGTYTYTSEDGTVTIIDVPASVVANFETIVNDGPVTINGNTYTTIEEYIISLANASVNLDGGDMITVTGTGTAADPYVVSVTAGAPDSMLITNAAGDLEWATIASIVQANETVTTLIDNANGTYTYTSEDGTVTIIDVPASVVANFETIVNDGPVTINGNTYTTIEEYIISLANASVNLDGGDMITVTGTGTAADPYIVSVQAGAPDSMLITNAAGDLEWATIASIVQDNETVTTLIDNANGTYTYTSEDGTVTIIDVPASVVANFETIVNDGPVTINGTTYTTIEEYIISLANASVNLDGGDMITVTGTGTAADPYIVSVQAGAPDSMLITNASGDLEWATIASIVQDNETVTTLIDNANGTYTYTSEDGTVTIIDVPASVVANFETIVNDGPVTINGTTYTTIEEYIISLANASVNLDGGDMITVTGTGTAADPYIVSVQAGAPDSMLITNAAGDLEWATISSVIVANETVTILVDNGDGTFTYTNEAGAVVTFDATRANITDNGNGTYTVIGADGNPVIIDIPADIINNFENIVYGGPVTVGGNIYNNIEEYFTYLVEQNQALTAIIDNGDGTFTYTDEDGNSVTFDANTTTMINNGDGTYIFTNANGDSITVDVIGDVVNNIQNNGAIYDEIMNLINAGSDSLIDNGNGTYTHTAVDGTVVVIDANTTSVTVLDGVYTFTDAAGNVITTIDTNADAIAFDNTVSGLTASDVQAAIDELANNLANTSDELVDNGNGTYTHTAVDGTVVVIDANTTSVTVLDGVYTFTDAAGNVITTIDTNADAIAFDNTASGLTASDVQAAIDELANNLANTSDELVDNGNGTYTHTAVDGTVVIIDGNTTSVTVLDGVYTFTDAAGNIITTIDTNADAIAFDNTVSGLTASDVQAAIDELANNLANTSDELVDNGNGTYTHTAVDGTVVVIDANTTSVTVLDGVYTFTDAAGNVITTIDTNADAIAFDNTVSGLTASDVQAAIDELANNLANTSDELVDNGNGTYTHTAVDGTVVVIDANTTSVTVLDGVYTFTDAAGNVITTIDTNADAIAFDNTVSGLTASDVQAAIDELANNLANTSDELVDNGNGTYTHTAVDGTVVIIDANTTSVTVLDGVYTFTDAAGNVITTIDTNADAIAFDNTASGLTASDVQAAIDELANNLANTSDELVDNGDGTYTHTAVDGTVVIIDANTTSVTVLDGVYTFTDAAGNVITTIDTNADAIAFDNTVSGLTASDVQAAIDELANNLANTSDELVDNGNGTYTHTAVDGTVVVIDANTTSVTVLDGVYTFTDAAGNVITTIDTNADAIAFDNTVSGLTASDVQAAIDELANNLANTSDELVDNGDGTYTHTAVDGTVVVIDANTTSVTVLDGVYTFTDAAGNVITTIDTNADAIAFDNTVSGLTASDVQAAIDELANNLANTSDELVDNGNGTYTHTAVDGTVVIIDANTTSVTVLDGVYTFTDAAGNVITTIDTNADAIAFDNTVSGLTASDVQAAIDELANNLANTSDELVDNGNGTYTHTAVDGTVVVIDANTTSVTVLDGVYTFTDAAGNVITTIDTNADAIAFDNTASGLTASDVQAAIDELANNLANTSDELVDNGNGTYTHTAVDGTVVVIDANTTSVTVLDGVYTFTDAAGNVITTIDTNADAIAFDNTASGLTASDVQAAIDELANNLANTSDELVDNGNGTYTHTAVDGTVVVIDANTTSVTVLDGVYTFTDAAGNVITTIDTNADAIAFDNTVSGLTASDVQAAIDELANNLANTSDELVDNGNGTYTHTAVDGTVVIIDANTTSVTVLDGVYTFTDAAGNVITTIDTNADAIAFDNTASGLTASDVQAAIDELANNLANTSDELVDNGNGTYTHTAVDGTVVVIDANTTSVTVLDGVYTFTDAAGNVITTIDTNADAIAFDNSTNGFTATNVQGAIEEISNTITLNKGDLTVDGGLEFIGVTDGLNKLLADAGIQIADGGITTDKISDGAVTNEKVGDDAITSDKILDGTILPEDIATADPDQVLTTDINGNPVWVDQSEVGEIVDATNGLNKDGLDIKLGGTLIEPTTITTDATNTLAIAGLEAGTVEDRLVVVETDGTLRAIKAAMPKFFYMPAIIFDTSVNGTFTRNLHSEYQAQFTGTGNPTLVSSSGATNAIPTLPANELEYHITYYDTTVFANLSIDANGLLTYDIIGNATEASYMTIVFVVK
ncbi:hypothetical protein EI546_05765 [Aequorivita sp. H23M31]|uniref:Uncharacterized protein n=1 Tax=Aequorivita ciconiae TaxID=2494375 RepID=A0A410G1X1_9FLAO|nr:hypothetical protein [Aequorivita sp. H23M31]QAA81263.1 hypothetical protein EI546_05765 [Aequorivita sp. H23M31]